MKFVPRLMVACYLIFILSSCSAEKEGDSFDLKTLDAEMKQEGWSRLEILGEQGESVAKTWLESKTARTVRAFWETKGNLQEKAYQQTNSLFGVATFQKANGDTFSVVFFKPSPK